MQKNINLSVGFSTWELFVLTRGFNWSKHKSAYLFLEKELFENFSIFAKFCFILIFLKLIF